MNDIKTLIYKHFYNNPLFKELKNTKECQELKSLLPMQYQEMILFCYIKNSILYFCLKHPLALQELKRDSSIFMIKALLKTIIMQNQNSIFKDINDIKFFVGKDIKPKKLILQKPQFSIPISKGEFKNSATNKQIYDGFEKIRKIIKSKHCVN